MQNEDERPASGKTKARKKLKRQRRERGKLHLYQQSSGIWYMRGTVANQTIHKSTDTHSEEHAKRTRDDLERKLLDERVYGKQVIATFSDAVKSYKALKGYNGFFRRIDVLEAQFGKTLLKDIDEAAIHRYALEKLPAATNTSRNTMLVDPMRTVMRHAARQKMCAVPMIQSFPSDGKEIDGMDDAWIETFLTGCGDVVLKTLVALMTTTAVRCTEALRLKWVNVDFEAGVAYLPAEDTKAGKGRELAFTGTLGQMLQSLPREGGRVFERWEVGESKGTRAVNSRIAYWCRKLKIEHSSTHRLGRHSFAERWLARGGTLHGLMDAGGWTDYDSVQRYAKYEKKVTQEQTRAMGADLLKPKLKVVGGN